MQREAVPFVRGGLMVCVLSFEQSYISYDLSTGEALEPGSAELESCTTWENMKENIRTHWMKVLKNIKKSFELF